MKEEDEEKEEDFSSSRPLRMRTWNPYVELWDKTILLFRDSLTL